MILREIYERPIDRTLNPAVSAGSLDEATVKTEIDEYVFTEEIIDGLYDVMNSIRLRQKSHAGIWINGYFGSGKSHFLKYLNYCFDAKYRDHALERLENEVAEKFDPLTHAESKLNEDLSQIRELIAWLKKADVERILFNIAQVHDYQGEEKRTFLDVFWNEFNRHRGYNAQNLALAQYFEKTLDRHGKLEDFKKLMTEEGFDWAHDANELAVAELDMVLEMGKQVCPSLSVDSIREQVNSGKVVLSVERFTDELADFLKNKGEDYRLVFLVDEVSQFINSRRNLLLQLQSIVEMLPVVCQKKVWVACTAQQDLSEIVESCEISETSDDYGKIMGRFEVKMSLKGMNPEYITRCRVLEKNGLAIGELGKMFDAEKSNLDLQFKLPATYKAYETRDDFINYYPFVPYQLRLIQQVFNAFESLGFVVSEVKGNERSVLKVTYSTAQQTANNEIGYIVPFDQFFSTMFQGSLMAKGQRALNNAAKIARDYADPAFAARVVNTLFMVSNLNPSDRQLFKATVDNLVVLLMDKCDANILVLKNDIQAVLDYLCKNSAIRKETDNMKEDIYLFYNEDEMNLATQIRSSKLDPTKRAETMWELICKYYDIQQKKSFHSRSFSIGVELWNRSFYSPNTSDIVVDIVMDSEYVNAETHAYGRDQKYLTVFLAPFYSENSSFRENFYNYCQTQSFIEHNPAPNATLQKIYQGFQERAEILLETKILPELHKFLDSCSFVSRKVMIPASEVSKKGRERFAAALYYHMNSLYSDASLVDGFPTDAAELSKLVMRPFVGAGQIEEQLPIASQRVELKLATGGFGSTCSLTELIKDFAKPPYGWNDVCTLAAINFLVRSRKFCYVYGNDNRVDQKTVAAKLYKERDKFEIQAAELIPQDIVNAFLAAWKKAFTVVTVCESNDTTAIFDFCKENETSGLAGYKKQCDALLTEFAKYPFVNVVRSAIDQIDSWAKIRDTRKFFETVTQEADAAFEIFSKIRDLVDFKKERFETYKAILEFVSGNKDNFDQLEGFEATVDALRKIVDDEWPLNSIRGYKKQKDELSKAIKEKMDQKVQAIREAYERAFASLEEFGKALNLKNSVVTYLPNKDAVIEKNVANKSLVALDLALKNVEDFESTYKQILVNEKAKQDAAAVPPAPVAEPAPTSDKPTSTEAPVTPAVPAKPSPRVFDPKKELKFHSGRKLTNEKDIDEYLADIKKQLMEQVNNTEIIIL